MKKPVYNSTAETKWKPNPKLTRKENAVIHHIVTNPKSSATEAVMQAYDVKRRETARVMAHELTHKPSVMAELAKYSTEAELTVLDVMAYSKDYGRDGGKDGASYASVALQAANSVLDRLHGKATQKTENATIAVTLNVDLSSAS